jgi:glycine hydroxymethyltransferase
MSALTRRSWVPDRSEHFVQEVADSVAHATAAATGAEVLRLIELNREIHERSCVNLNPATNTMNPAAEAVLARGLGSRPSLGYPGAKYEMGLEAIERIEIIAAELAAAVFDAPFAEVRVGSGALANLYTFMATTSPGDAIIVPPASIGGHVTHHHAGAAGLYGLDVHDAPVDHDRYTVDVDRLASMAARIRPRLITIGGSLNLFHHPVAEIRAVADSVGAAVMFDAAHLSGPIAGGAWPNPLHEGAHVMTMSTYKSLGGPPSGLLVTNDPGLAQRIDAIAFPGLTANFDVASTAALAITLLDWQEYGTEYAAAMVAAALALAAALHERGLPVHVAGDGATRSHAFALDAGPGGGHAMAARLRQANLLTSAIGLPADPAAGVRVGTNEVVRWGMTAGEMAELGALFARAWEGGGDGALAAEVTTFRSRFDELCFIR